MKNPGFYSHPFPQGLSEQNEDSVTHESVTAIEGLADKNENSLKHKANGVNIVVFPSKIRPFA